MLFAVNFKPKILSTGRIFIIMFIFINTYPVHPFFLKFNKKTGNVPIFLCWAPVN